MSDPLIDVKIKVTNVPLEPHSPDCIYKAQRHGHPYNLKAPEPDHCTCPCHLTAHQLKVKARQTVPALVEALEDCVNQFAYWIAGDVGGLSAGGLSTLERAFYLLGLEDPHPRPDRRCDEPGCMEDATCGWPTRPGGTGPNGGYRRTCWPHMRSGREALGLPP